MAITDIDISEKLEAGAPSIKYTGDMDPQNQMASDPSWGAEWDEIYNDYKLKQIELGQEFISKEEFIDMQRDQGATGGRAHLGLGSMLKSIGKSAKKFVKSPIGKAALLGLGAYGANAGWFGGGMKGWAGGLKSGLFGQTPFLSTTGAMKGAAGFPGTSGILGKWGLTAGKGSMMPTALGWGTAAVGAGAMAAAFEGMEEDDVKALRNNPEALRNYLKQYHTNTHPDKSEKDVDIWVEQNMYSTGGRVGLRDGTDDMTISNNPRDPKNMTTVEIISIIKEGRSTPEMFAELRVRGIEGVDEVEIAEFGKTGGSGDVAYSFDERLVDKYDPETGTSNESFLMNLRESNPDVYGKYRRPQNYPEKDFTMEPSWMKSDPTWAKAQGGRIGFAFGPDQTAQAAGIMGQLPVRNNGAGVKELDLRDSGGFIPPVGVKEKADDIPAMLSNNEFVFTADAVKAAGGGSVEKGAQVMYDQMKQLENRVG